MKKLLYLIILCVAMGPLPGLLSACSEEEDCSMTARPMLQCNIYRAEYTGTLLRDTLDSLTVTAYATDSLIINNQQDVKDISIPLRYTTDSTVLVFHYDQRYRDTVVIHHENTPYFISLDCGYQMQQTVTGIRYTRHRLDSIYTINPDANIYGTENLRLYY